MLSTSAEPTPSQTDPDAPIESGYATADDGVKIYYEIRGSGPTLVILNNFFMTASHWAGFTRRICRNYRVISYDLRHQGQSDRVERAVSIDDHVTDLHTLITHLNLPKCSLLGTCVSTLICRDYVLAHPDQVDSVIMVGPIFNPFGGRHRRYLHKSLLNSLTLGGVPALFDHYYPLLYTPRSIEINRTTGYLALKARFIANNPAEQLEKHLHSTVNADDNPQTLKALTTPTLLLAGEGDFLTDETSLSMLTKLMPDCRYEIIPMAGHNPYVDATAEFEKRVVDFLSTIEPLSATA